MESGEASVRRRGRKPKEAVAVPQNETSLPPDTNDFLTVSQDVTNVGQPNATSSTQKPKRGRKPKQVFMCHEDNEEGVMGRSVSDDENVVLNLKVFDNNNDLDESIEPPDGFNLNGEDDAFLSRPYEFGDVNIINSTHHDEDFDTQHEQPNNKPEKPKTSTKEDKHKNLKVVHLLKDFEEKNKHNEWPMSTSIHCYWCCHRFNNVPFGIPVKFVNEKFHVVGCFCSLECSAAHNMKHYDSSDEMWERYMLINMLSRRLGKHNIVKPAPDRLALKIFGGHMDIEEFRSYCDTGKIIINNFPPMMTLTQQLEESNESDITSDLKYIPIDTDRINKYKEKMKLKRQKPISNFANTLDHAMNLKFSS